jgi:hypothetical protein
MGVDAREVASDGLDCSVEVGDESSPDPKQLLHSGPIAERVMSDPVLEVAGSPRQSLRM